MFVLSKWTEWLFCELRRQVWVLPFTLSLSFCSFISRKFNVKVLANPCWKIVKKAIFVAVCCVVIDCWHCWWTQPVNSEKLILIQECCSKLSLHSQFSWWLDNSSLFSGVNIRMKMEEEDRIYGNLYHVNKVCEFWTRLASFFKVFIAIPVSRTVEHHHCSSWNVS